MFHPWAMTEPPPMMMQRTNQLFRTMSRIHQPIARGLITTALLLCASLPAATPPELKFTTPQRGEIHRFVTLPGSIKANQQATLYAKVPGYLKSIKVDIGDTVKAGQLLAEIEVPELSADLVRAKAAVARAEAEKAKAATSVTKARVELNASQTDYDRVSKARKSSPDLITPQALDDAKARFDSAKASLAEAQAGENLAAARSGESQAELKRIEALLAFAQVQAPFAGTITERFVDAGAFIPAATSGSAARNAAILTLMDFDTVRASVGVPELEASLVQNGQPVKVAVQGLANRVFSGVITRHSFALDDATRLLHLEADLPNAQKELRPGMYATIRVGVEKHTNALLIPVGALLMEKANASVFQYVDGKAKKTPVKLGFNDGTNVEIASGLSGGERVLIFGKAAPADGQAVNATEAK